MRPVSAAFLRALTGSHTPVYRATVCVEFQTGVTPVGPRIPILAGDVTLDAAADITATLDMTTVDTWPTIADATLAPYGNEIYVERGIRFNDVQVEWVGLGYFRIQAPEQDQAPNGSIRLTGRDRMAGIVDGRLLAPVTFDTGATLGFIASTLVTDVYPDAVIEWDDATDDDVTTRPLTVERDRHPFLRDLFAARGKVARFDHRGVLAIASPPDPAEPVWTVASGEGGVLVALSRELTREGVYNAVVATGEAGDDAAPVWAAVVDADPNSPTRYGGRFGKVPRFFSSPLLATTGQAQAAAETLLRQNLGLPYNVDLTAVPNPALVPDDPVRVLLAGREETHVMARLVIPLGKGAMKAATRERTVVLIGSA